MWNDSEILFHIGYRAILIEFMHPEAREQREGTSAFLCQWKAPHSLQGVITKGKSLRKNGQPEFFVKYPVRGDPTDPTPKVWRSKSGPNKQSLNSWNKFTNFSKFLRNSSRIFREFLVKNYFNKPSARPPEAWLELLRSKHRLSKKRPEPKTEVRNRGNRT